MSTEIILKALEDSVGKTQEKLSAQIEAAMKKHAEEIQLHGKAAEETKAELKALAEKHEKAVIELAQKFDNFRPNGGRELMSAGEEFVKTEQFKQLASGLIQRARIEVKNTVTSGSTTVFPQQRPGVIAGDFAPLTVRQVLRTIPVATNMVNALRELSWVNSARPVTQGATKPESDITFEQYNVAIETVAHTIKVSNQLMADAPAIMAYIDSRLRDGLGQVVENQLLNGNGNAPNLSGLTDSGNFTAYTANSNDLLIDAIRNAKYAMWARGRVPDTVIVSPSDWSQLEGTRENGTSGQYLYGAPGAMAGMNPFGMRVVISNYIQDGKFIVAALNSSVVLYQRQGAVIEAGYVNDDFQRNLVTLRAEERLGLAVDAPSGVTYGDFTA